MHVAVQKDNYMNVVLLEFLLLESCHLRIPATVNDMLSKNSKEQPSSDFHFQILNAPLYSTHAQIYIPDES